MASRQFEPLKSSRIEVYQVVSYALGPFFFLSVVDVAPVVFGFQPEPTEMLRGGH